MALLTRKFSEFITGSLNATNKVVGLSAGANAIFEVPTNWTTGTRPTTPTDGLLGYNTTLAQYEYFDETAGLWQQLLTNVSGMDWSEITVGAVTATVDNGYITNAGGVVAVTLPALAELGDRVAIMGKGSGGWSLIANAGQTIQFGNQVSSTAGSISSTNRYDNVEVACMTTNSEWQVRFVIGNLTVA